MAADWHLDGSTVLALEACLVALEDEVAQVRVHVENAAAGNADEVRYVVTDNLRWGLDKVARVMMAAARLGVLLEDADSHARGQRTA